VKNGVNMAFSYDKKKVGVVGITGNPEEVKPIALIIKMSIETTLEYEIYKDKIFQRRNSKEQFLHYLLYGEKIHTEVIEDLAKQLGYQDNVVRIPILIVFENKINTQEILSGIKKGEYHSNQDISNVIGDKQLIIFKHFDTNKEELFNTYKYMIGEYLTGFLNFIRKEKIACKIFVGTFQNKFDRYSISFQHCQWLKKNVTSKPNKIGYYFYDYVGQYMKSQLPIIELYNIYHILEDAIDDEFKNILIETVEVLERNNYNLVESSKELFVHKNTLVFRFNKIRERFDINPIQKANDRGFLNFLQYYLKII